MQALAQIRYINARRICYITLHCITLRYNTWGTVYISADGSLNLSSSSLARSS